MEKEEEIIENEVKKDILSKRLLLLLNGSIIGIFKISFHLILSIILSCDGKYCYITLEGKSQVHLTKYTPNEFIKYIKIIIEFKNTYSINSSPFICSRIYGQTSLDNYINNNNNNNLNFLSNSKPSSSSSLSSSSSSSLSSNISYCPFLQRVCYNIPVIFQDESPCGLINTFDTFFTFIRRIAPLNPNQKLPNLINITLNNEIYHNSQEFPSINNHDSSMHNILEFFEEIAQELTLLQNNSHYFPSTYIVTLELVDDIIYIHSNYSSSTLSSNSFSFQIWFDIPSISTFSPSSISSSSTDIVEEMKWEDGEIITLENETLTHQIHKNNLNNETIVNEDSINEKKFKVFNNSYHISILEIEDSIIDNKINSPLILFLKRKTNIIHLLALRDHFFQLSTTLNHIQLKSQSKIKYSPSSLKKPTSKVLSTSPITTNSTNSNYDLIDHSKTSTIVKSIRIDNERSGLYLLSDGKVRGTFPLDLLYLEYDPDIHSVYVILPNGEKTIFSVETLLNRKQQLKMLERRLDSNDIISIITKRTIQLLRFRCQYFSPLFSESLNQRIESTVILNQFHNKTFLNKVKSMLSDNS